VCLFAAIAVANAGVANYNGAAVIAPTITSEQQNVLRSYGNLQQVSYNSKTIDTPYSSVSKSDVRVSNPGIQVAQVAPAHVSYCEYTCVFIVPNPLALPINNCSVQLLFQLLIIMAQLIMLSQ
jgi:Pupal cuticle protein C1